MHDIDGKKYRQAILGFLCECDGRRVDRVTLLALLYFLDFDHFERYDAPVTGDTYLKLPHGPVPRHAEQVLAGMEREGLLVREPVRTSDEAGEHFTPSANAAYDPAVFAPTEREVLARVRRRWREASRREIVEAARRQAPWIAVEEGGEIPYAYAYYRNTYGELDVSGEEGGYLDPEELIAAA